MSADGALDAALMGFLALRRLDGFRKWDARAEDWMEEEQEVSLYPPRFLLDTGLMVVSVVLPEATESVRQPLL